MSASTTTTAPLGSLCEVITKGSSPNWQGFEYCERGIPFVRSQNVGWGNLDLSDVAHLPEAFNQKERKSVLRTDDVLLNLVGASIGRACVATSDVDGGNVNQAVAVIRVRKNVLAPKYLKWFLISPIAQARIHSEKVDVARANFSLEDTRNLPVTVIPLGEQRRIVAEIEKQFTRLEAGLAALRRVQANLKRYRAAVLKAACEGKLVEKQSEWPTITLGEICTVLAGYGFPERLQGRTSGDIGFYKVGDISETWKRGEKILTQANHYISKADLAELRAKLLSAGTVVFAKIGAAIALNRRAIIGEPSLVDNNVMGLLAGERINPRFLFHFTCTLKLDDLARATTVPSIRKGDVEGIELQLPPLAEQTRIVAEVERRLSVVEELESVVSASLQRATRLRQSILQKAFTGELLTERTLANKPSSCLSS